MEKLGKELKIVSQVQFSPPCGEAVGMATYAHLLMESCLVATAPALLGMGTPAWGLFLHQWQWLYGFVDMGRS